MNINEIPTPSYVIDEGRLEDNLKILKSVAEAAGCSILLAQKAFSAFSEYPLIAKYLAGCTASGLYEARLGAEEMGKENHIFSPAYKESEIEEIASICDHVIFNSFNELERFASKVYEIQKSRGITDGIGIRINPECSTQDEAIYDPCAPGSRLGVTKKNFRKGMEEHPEAFALVSGIHCHTLCEQDSDALETTLAALRERFGDVLALPQMKWLNLGGGHHITKKTYDRDRLIRLVKGLKEDYPLNIYLEPGEAIALNAGYLVSAC